MAETERTKKECEDGGASTGRPLGDTGTFSLGEDRGTSHSIKRQDEFKAAAGGQETL